MRRKISVVVPAYNEAENVPVLAQRVSDNLPPGYDYEIIFVDDGSTDGTTEVLETLAEADPHVQSISFSRNFGHQAALRAGIDYAQGDCVISMDADLQHPPELLPELIELWEKGNDIVYTRRVSGAETGRLKRWSSSAFYKVINSLSGLSIEEGAADFRLVDRRVAEVIRGLKEPDLFLRGFITWCGFRTHAVDYRPAPRFSGRSKYSLRKMLQLALHGITQFSIKPLRMANVLGVLSALAGVLYGLYAVYERVFADNAVSGWTSVVISVLVLGGVQLMVLGIIGEYLGRTFIQTKERPDYIVRTSTLEPR